MNRKKVLILLFALLASCGVWAQNDWDIQASYDDYTDVTTFTISRSNTAVAETVKYRLVNLSAYAGQHYNVILVNGQPSSDLSGDLRFLAGDESKTVQVRELTATTDAYKYQTGTERSYKLEVTDSGGFYLAGNTRSFSTGTSVTSSGVFDTKNVTIQTSAYTANDRGYDDNGYKSVDASSYCTSGTQAYLGFLNAQLRMTLSFDAKENDDAYEYLQILFDNTTTCDNRSGAGNGNPGTPNLSRYMAGFEINSGSKDDSYKSYSFPVTSVGDNASATNPWGHGTDYPLTNQKFKSGFHATDGRLIVPTDFSTIVLRLNASGSSGSDEWAAKNVKAHIQAIDNTAPTKLAVSVAPGKHCKGDTVYVSVAFNEIIKVTGTPTLTTTDANHWGSLSYISGDGTNVLTFSTTIPDDATGNLNITGLSGTVKDLAGNSLNGNGVTANNLCSLDASYNYSITCDLAGGSVATSNPATYTWETATFTLINPTRTGYTFDGWTGSNGNTPQNTVIIANHSHGNKSYTANWTPIDYSISYDLDDGSVTPSNPTTYTIESENITLVNPTRANHIFLGWTGTDLAAPTKTVTIAQGSTGDRSYTAHWHPLWGIASGANGSTDHPYLIASTIDLDSLAARTNRGNSYSETYFLQTADITYDGTTNNYTPVGRFEANPFCGNYNGDGYTISGINISSSLNEYGLFGRISTGAMVQNVTLASSTITAHESVGGIVGYKNRGTVQNCRVESSVTINADRGSAFNHGGVVGYNYSGTIIGCLCAATLSSNDGCYYHGGITGRHDGGNIQNCLFTGPTPLAYSSKGSIAGSRKNTAYLSNNYYTVSTLGGVNGNDVNNARKARTVTLGANISLVGTETAYSVSGLTAIGTNALRLANGTIYSGYDQMLTIAYNGNTPAGYYVVFSYNDGSDHPLAGNTFRVPLVDTVHVTSSFVATTYTLTYDLAGGSMATPNPTSYTVESGDITLVNPTRSGYTFAGWTGTDLTEPTTTVTIAQGSTGNRSYTATWSPVTYTIIYDLSDGSLANPNPTSYTVESTDITLTNPTRDHYTFAGWTGTGLAAPTTTVTIAQGSTGDRTYTATWTPIDYTITYNLAGGSAFNPISYTIESDDITLANPTRSGYTFAGWTGTDLAEPTMTVTIAQGSTGDRTYTATWNIIDYTISYDLAGGSLANPNPTTYTVESDDITLVNPTRDGYVFAGWTGTGLDAATPSVTIAQGSTGNRTYTATWVVGYSITYDLAGGSVATPNPSYYIFGSGDITLVNPTRDHYTFAGWTGTDLAEPTMTVTIAQGSTGDRSYTATWTPIDYTLSYNLNGGSASNPTSYTVETATFILTIPTRDGYTFVGWTGTGLNEATQSVTIAQGSTGNRTYTATWSPIVYSITYNLNGGSVATPNPTSYTVETATFTLNNPTRDGYAFAGWTGTDLNVTTPSVTIARGSTGNRTYTAIWLSSWGDAEHDGTTAERAYILSTTDDLNLLASRVNAGDSYSGTFFRLGADITYNDTSDWNNISATENNYTAIGTSNHPFSGILDGCGHTVSGIRIYSSSNYRGLFGYVSGGTVKNLSVADTRITGKESCGGVVGYNNGTVENCHATATVAVYASRTSANYHGGVVGNNVGLVDGCTSSATVNYNDYYWSEYYGGVVGRNAGTTRRCLSIGAVVSAFSRRDPVVYNDGGTVASCHHRNCRVDNGYYNDLNTIDVGTDVTASPAGDSTGFPYGGLQCYGSCLFILGGTLYAPEDSTVSLNLTYTGSNPLFRGFSTSDGSLASSANPYSLTISSYYSNVTLQSVFVQSVPCSYGFEEDDGWAHWNSLSGDNRIFDNFYNCHEGSNYLLFHGSTSNIVVLPPFTAATPTLQLSFWSQPLGSQSGTFSVGYLTDPGDTTTFVALRTYSYSDWTSSVYRRKTVNFEKAPDGARLAFRHNPTGNNTYWDVDDVVVTAYDCFPPEELAVSNIGVNAATLSWLAVDNVQWEYALVANAAADYSPTDAQFTPANALTQSSINAITIDTLAELTNYAFFLRRACSAQSKSEVVSVRFCTLMTPVPLPYTNDFESSNGWMLENGTLTNQWVWGTAAHNGEGTKSLYISNDGGTTNAYSNGATTVYAWKLFSFEEGLYSFSYDWRSYCQNSNNYLRVALVPDGTELTAGESGLSGFSNNRLPDGWIPLDGGSYLSGWISWQRYTTAPIPVAAGNYKVVFIWRNYNSFNNDLPAAVDNVRITKYKHFVTAGSWNDDSNWSPAGVPAADDAVYIEAAAVIPAGSVAVCDRATVTFNGGSVTIADGGQLVCNESIPVTVQKNVVAGQWNGISGLNYVNDLTSLTAGADYDLFSYDEEHATWINQKAHSENFNYLRYLYGYIYRRAASTTVNLSTSNCYSNGGTSYDASCSDDALRGFNLAGNPYTHNIYFGTGITVEEGGSIAPGFYTLNADGTWRAHTTADPIHVAEAFLIQVTTDDAYLRFYNTNAAPVPSKAGAPATLAFSVKGNGHEDIAYALLGTRTSPSANESLRKMPHLNAEAPSLSIDGYAIATLGEETEAFPLTLQAQPGEYTLGTRTSSSAIGYLHLIDRLAGRDIDLLQTPTYTFTQSRNHQPLPCQAVAHGGRGRPRSQVRLLRRRPAGCHRRGHPRSLRCHGTENLH